MDMISTGAVSMTCKNNVSVKVYVEESFLKCFVSHESISDGYLGPLQPSPCCFDGRDRTLKAFFLSSRPDWMMLLRVAVRTLCMDTSSSAC